MEDADHQECLDEELGKYGGAKLAHLVKISIILQIWRWIGTMFYGGQTLVHDDFTTVLLVNFEMKLSNRVLVF